MKFDKWILTEAAYPGNMGIVEMIKFYKVASKQEIKEMEKATEKKDWGKFREIIKKVIGVELV
jgi:hypothetical protein